ncbi:MAG TPA: heterodisulfide reductase-related iron-sulfur binding cluster [Gemmatimonadaceae bacterium]|nr:heterodisulfide reductase-related iron-sulfur binding cluster [Gemmatimonadaceae bacterium]
MRDALPVMDAAAAAKPCALPGSPLAQAAAGIDACVHCGFCLQACPTYLALEDENDSPRGRIVLMRGLLDGTVTIDDPVVHRHIDQCLGCRGCETACPSGVPYGQLLEATRATLRRAHQPPLIARLILGTFASAPLLRLALVGARVVRALGIPQSFARLPGRLGSGMAMLASTRQVLEPRAWQARGDGSNGDVTLLTGCVMQGLQAATNEATVRTLTVNDYRVVDTPRQGCCGALHAHAGDLQTARALAKVNITAFEVMPQALIAVNAAGCGAMIKEYPHLLHDEPTWYDRALAVSARTRDASELLAAAGPKPARLPSPIRITYDAPCHLQHAQRLTSPPMAVLQAIGNLTHVPLEDSDQCCGSAGIYNLIEPHVSDAVLVPKLRNIAATGATLVVTGNPGCLMQIGAGLLRSGATTRVVHPIDLLDAAYAADAAP